MAEGTEGDIEWGEGCDTELGLVEVPISNAAPCVEPWDETEDNGGATAQGVTADEILVVNYKGQPDPLQQALVEDAGANTDPEVNNQVEVDYINLFADVYETYGRTVRVETIEASGGPDDATAAQADALRAIELKPFAVVGSPTTDAWSQEIANAGIVCVACGSTESADKVAENAPYWWPTGMNPEQADAHLVEMVGKQLVGKPAEFAGDEAMHSEERVFGWIQAETETDEYKARNDAFEEELASEYDGEIATRFTYLFDPTQAADIATTAIARMKEAGVTSIIISTDPLIPANITKEATAQNYFPEWIIGPSVLADTTHLRPYLRPGAVDARPRPRAHRGPGRAGALRLVPGVRVVLRRAAGGEHAGRARARARAPGPGHPPRRSEPHARELRARHVPLAALRHGAHRPPGLVGRGRVAATSTATPATTPPPSGGTLRPPARTRPATRAPARSCTSTAGSGSCPASGPPTRSRGSTPRARSPSTTSDPTRRPSTSPGRARRRPAEHGLVEAPVLPRHAAGGGPSRGGTMAETNNGGTSGGGAKALKRYGPILLVVVIIAAVIAIASGGGDDDDDDHHRALR